jgi:hypothetical protein
LTSPRRHGFCAFAWQALAVVGWGVVFAGLGLGAPVDLT